MAWIESHQSLSRHRKTLRAATALKVDRHKLIGHLHELWWWALDNADIYGLLPECSSAELAEAAGWRTTDAQRFVDALVSAGFIDSSNDGLTLRLHDWYEYAGKLNEQRAENRERMRRRRESPQPPHEPGTNGTRAEHVRRTNGARAPATVPNRTVPNQPVDDTPSLRSGDLGPTPIRSKKPSGNPRVVAVIDAFRAMSPSLVVDLGPRDYAAIKGSTAPPELIAECYDAVRRGDWGDQWKRDNLSVHAAVDWVNAYREQRPEPEREDEGPSPSTQADFSPTCMDCREPSSTIRCPACAAQRKRTRAQRGA